MNFSTIPVRTKALFGFFVAAILVGGGFFAYNTSKLKSSADTITPAPTPTSTTVTVPLTLQSSFMGATLTSYDGLGHGTTNVSEDPVKAVAVVSDKNANTYVSGMLNQLWYRLEPLSVTIPDNAQNITLNAQQGSVVMASWGVNICSGTLDCKASNANTLSYNGAPWKPADLNHSTNALFVGFVNPKPSIPFKGFKLSQLDVSITYNIPTLAVAPSVALTSASLHGIFNNDQHQPLPGLKVSVYKASTANANLQDFNQVPLGSATTDSKGYFLVNNLPITIVWVVTGGLNSGDSCDTGIKKFVSLTAGDNYISGGDLAQGIIVKGLVNKWDDATQGLVPYPGAIVKLGELNDDVVLSAQSDSTGNYQFCVDARHDGELVRLISPINDYHNDKQFKLTKPVTIGPLGFQ